MNIMIGSRRAGFNAVQVNIAAFEDQMLRDYGNADLDVARNMKSEELATLYQRQARLAAVSSAKTLGGGP